MDGNKITYQTIDAYILQFPSNIQEMLQKLRKTIQETVPEAKEKISYGMPTFTLEKNLVHFAAYKNHIGLYPGSRAIAVFADRLSAYKLAKGTIQFPIEQPLPYELIKEIVQYLVAVDKEKAAKHKKS